MDLATRRDLDRIAAEAVPLPGTLDVTVTVEHTHGEKIAGTDLWSGVGGSTAYCVAWFDGRMPMKPYIAAFADQHDAYDLVKKLTDPDESELGARKEARRRRIMELDELEASAEAAAKAEAKEAAKTARHLKRAGVDIAEATGGGSSRRSTSSARPTATTGKPRGVRRKR